MHLNHSLLPIKILLSDSIGETLVAFTEYENVALRSLIRIPIVLVDDFTTSVA